MNVPPLISSTDPMIRLPSLVGLGASTIAVLILFLVLVIQRLWVVRHRRREQFRAAWFPLLIQSLVEIPQTFPPIRPKDVHDFFQLWNYLHESIRGDGITNLDHVMRVVCLDRVATKMLKNHNLSDRLMAVVVLGHLRERSVWNELRRLADSPPPELSLAAARSLILIDPQAALSTLSPLFGSRSDWSFVKVANMLNEAGPELAAQSLAPTAWAASPEDAARLLRCLEATGSPRALPVVRQIIGREDGDDRVVIACLRCFGRFGGPQDLNPVRARLGHQNWLIRLHAVIALCKIGTEEDEQRLINRLEDDEWWVRYRAAEGLASLPFVNRDKLARIQAEHPQQQTRDILAPFTVYGGCNV